MLAQRELRQAHSIAFQRQSDLHQIRACSERSRRPSANRPGLMQHVNPQAQRVSHSELHTIESQYNGASAHLDVRRSMPTTF